MDEFKIEYGANTLTIGDLKKRLEWLTTLFPEGEPLGHEPEHVTELAGELAMLQDLAFELNWMWDSEDDGRTLIFEDYFDQFARQECYDLGDVKEGGIVDSYVDWDKVAAAIQQDYKAVRVGPDSLTYWVRA